MKLTVFVLTCVLQRAACALSEGIDTESAGTYSYGDASETGYYYNPPNEPWESEPLAIDIRYDQEDRQQEAATATAQEQQVSEVQVPVEQEQFLQQVQASQQEQQTVAEQQSANIDNENTIADEYSSPYFYEPPQASRIDYDLNPLTESEQNFQHQELGSAYKSRRHGTVTRLKLQYIQDGAARPTVAPTIAHKRPPGRRLIPYTETIVNENYLQG